MNTTMRTTTMENHWFCGNSTDSLCRTCCQVLPCTELVAVREPVTSLVFGRDSKAGKGVDIYTVGKRGRLLVCLSGGCCHGDAGGRLTRVWHLLWSVTDLLIGTKLGAGARIREVVSNCSNLECLGLTDTLTDCGAIFWVGCNRWWVIVILLYSPAIICTFSLSILKGTFSSYILIYLKLGYDLYFTTWHN